MNVEQTMEQVEMSDMITKSADYFHQICSYLYNAINGESTVTDPLFLVVTIIMQSINDGEIESVPDDELALFLVLMGYYIEAEPSSRKHFVDFISRNKVATKLDSITEFYLS